MARTKSFNESEALESAMLLFWQKGYAATSMRELEQITGLKLTSIYNAFGNKRELFQKALEYYLQTTLVRFIESLASAKTAKAALNAVLKEVIHLHYNKSHPGGCLVVLSLLESDQHDARTIKTLYSALHQLQKSITQRLEEGQMKGEIGPERNCQILGNHVIALITGMITMAKAGFSRKDLEKLINNSTDMFFQ